MLNYDKPSRIFPCILLTRNHMIFLVHFGINKHLSIFSKTTPDWKKWCLEKGIAEEIENDEPTQLNALLERSNAQIEKQTWLNLENDDSI